MASMNDSKQSPLDRIAEAIRDLYGPDSTQSPEPDATPDEVLLFMLATVKSTWGLPADDKQAAAVEVLNALLYGLVGDDTKLLKDLASRSRALMKQRPDMVGAEVVRENGKRWMNLSGKPIVNGGAPFRVTSKKDEGTRLCRAIVRVHEDPDRPKSWTEAHAITNSIAWCIVTDCPRMRSEARIKGKHEIHKAISPSVARVLRGEREWWRRPEKIAAAALSALGVKSKNFL